jgi:TRAP-type C4-dicarboxylate transport system permease small subunit
MHRARASGPGHDVAIHWPIVSEPQAVAFPKENELLMAQQDGPPADDAGPAPDEISAGVFAPPLEIGESAAQAHEVLLPTREPLRTIFRGLGLLEQIVGSLLLLLILVLVLAQVAYRYIPGAVPWTGELARLAMVWAAFLVAGYLIAYPPHHIAIQIVDYVAKGRWLAVVKLFVNLVILATSLFMIYGSYTLVTTAVDQVTPAGELSLRFVNSVPLVGLVLVALRAVLGIVIRDIPALLGRTGDET